MLPIKKMELDYLYLEQTVLWTEQQASGNIKHYFHLLFHH